MAEFLTAHESNSKTIRRKPKIAPLCLYRTPEWYKIHEISIDKYIECISGIYEILEDKNKPKSEDDVFASESWCSYYDIEASELEEQRKRIQKEKAFTMKWGDFHQKIMGSFNGWENYDKGHETGCDIGKLDGTCIAEIKNAKNTMNSSSQESVINKLKKQVELNKKALLVIVNGNIPKKEKDGITWISGREFYAKLSGRSNFFEDLRDTIRYTFKNFKTYNSLIDSLKMP
jgi:hypothetical protein